MTGEFCWYDLSTTDPEGAKAFYTALMGWEAEAWQGPMPYTMWKSSHCGAFGGVMTLAEEAKKMGAPPNWMGYVRVANVDETCTKASSLGGRVYVPATDIPGQGRFAILSDPQGAVFAVYAGNTEPPADWKSPCSWHELYTTDVEKAFAFYEGLFGWHKTDAMQMPEGGTYQMYGIGGKTIGGMMVKPPNLPMAAWAYYFTLGNTDEAFAKAQSLGAKVVYPPMDVPGGDRVAMMTDPQGATFAIHSRKA